MKTKTATRHSIEYYLGLKYSVTLHQSPEGGFVAEIEDLPGCLAQGETPAEAYQEIEKARKLWLETTYEDGQDIPLPRDDSKYSGKFIVRVPKTLHRKLDLLAEKEGTSLNQLVVAELSRAVGVAEERKRYSTVNLIKRTLNNIYFVNEIRFSSNSNRLSRFSQYIRHYIFNIPSDSHEAVTSPATSIPTRFISPSRPRSASCRIIKIFKLLSSE
jgi:predicted RNase H-like HicB family nuclease